MTEQGEGPRYYALANTSRAGMAACIWDRVAAQPAAYVADTYQGDARELATDLAEWMNDLDMGEPPHR